MTGKVTELTADNFDEFVKDDRVVIDFWAPWCGPCKMMGPILVEASEELKDHAKFGKVDVDENPDLAQRFQVMSIPSLLFFRDGKQVDRAVGVLSKEDLVKKAKGAK
ncbi:MAG: thioredoxin [Nanoarchaeota archaeon]